MECKNEFTSQVSGHNGSYAANFNTRELVHRNWETQTWYDGLRGAELERLRGSSFFIVFVTPYQIITVILWQAAIPSRSE